MLVKFVVRPRAPRLSKKRMEGEGDHGVVVRGREFIVIKVREI